MITVQRGDYLPTVAAVQVLLNARRDIAIPVDGAFGPITQNAVCDFQRMTNCSPVTGRVNNATWNRLNQGVNFIVHDAIDIADPVLLTDLDVIRAYNNHSIVIGGMSNSVEQIINTIIRSTVRGTLILVRFDGHGRSGEQFAGFGLTSIVLTAMFGASVPRNPAETNRRYGVDNANSLRQLFTNTITYSIISRESLAAIREFLSRLRPYFSPYGSIEFHGCRVARGAQGRHFMYEVSDIVGVPASGGLVSQSVGTVQSFEGATFTGCPNGLSLREWATNLPGLNTSLP
jgi:hypothetical protein